MEEIWKEIIGYEGLYQISNNGLVKSTSRLTPVILKQHDNKRGYLQVKLQKNNVIKTTKVHRLVAIHFIPNPNNYPQVNHIDGIKYNNKSDNLEWCNNQQNAIHAYKVTGIKKPTGKNHHNSKKVRDNITGIIYDSIREAAKTVIYQEDYVSSMLRGSKKNNTNLVLI